MQRLEPVGSSRGVAAIVQFPVELPTVKESTLSVRKFHFFRKCHFSKFCIGSSVAHGAVTLWVCRLMLKPRQSPWQKTSSEIQGP